ncbi:MAG TPA: protein kinase [Blastocatellia bacterium]|nr:protein kinase [Blastocatellia bacterium]
MTIEAGTILGRYEIRSKIGAGGMGEVYLAQDTNLDRKVALKILPPEVAANRDRMDRFVLEAKAASALNHPNIITIHEIDQTDSGHFIATEFIDGDTLRERMRSAPLTLNEVLDVAAQVASALSTAHADGIVHRDIKPENVMLRRDGIVKVLDFGLAKLTERLVPESIDSGAPTSAPINTAPGMVMGTAIYMSPEQARGLQVDGRTDIFSLGVLIYEMVAGRRPFVGSNTIDIFAEILSDKKPPPLARYTHEAPAELERIVEKALAKEREERYQSAKDLLIDLRQLKKRLEIDTELGRSTPPEMSERRPSGELSYEAKTASTGGGIPHKPTTSSAEYMVDQVKLHKRGVIITLGVLMLAIAGAIYWYLKHTPAPLTEKDTIVLADFVNTAGDPVFDGTLKQALAVQLEQSPFLNIFSDQRVREALRFMGRSPDERVTRDVGREICQRHGLKAMLVNSIASLGNHYVITLEAVNAQTGDTIASEQAEAENKEQVLRALGDAAMKLREKLGESLQSIQKFDARIEQGTTSSLEAFKAFSLGVEQQLKGKYLEAIPFLRRATEIDPNFALAYARMASMYYNSRQDELAAEASQKAFELRDRVSERERLYISAGYYDNVTGELEKYLETLELWKRTYPRDASPPNNLAVKYNELGLFDKSVEEAREAIRLNPSSASGYSLLAAAFLGLNRFDEAKEVIGQAQAQKLETTPMRRILFRIAFVQGDATTMKQQIESVNGKPDEYVAQGWQAETAAFSGQLQKAREFSDRAFELAERRGLKVVAAQILVAAATRDALFGDCRMIKEQTAKALGISRSQLTMIPAGNALATCGEFRQTQTISGELVKRFPKDTILNRVLLPLIQARVELHRGNPAQAIQLLETTRPYEGAAHFQVAYLRGQAYLSQQKGADAAAEFQKILDHRGGQITSPLYPLAHVGLARAAVLQDNAAKARTAYQDFFALWKDADPDNPILIQARKEYEKLK